MVSCSVRGCCSRDSVDKKENSGITFHKFPKNPERREAWVKFVSRGAWQPTKYSVLCSKHFLESCFDRTSRCYVRLKPEAIPSLNKDEIYLLPEKIHTSNTSAASTYQELMSPPVQCAIPSPLDSPMPTTDCNITNVSPRNRKLMEELQHSKSELIEEIYIKVENDPESYVSNQSVENCPEKIEPESYNGSNPSIGNYPESPLSKCPKIEIVFDQKEMNSVYAKCFENEFDNFGNDVANKLKELPHETAIVTQKLIDALLTESHLGNVTRYTKVILQDVRPP